MGGGYSVRWPRRDECAVVGGGSENKNQERRAVAQGLPPVAPPVPSGANDHFIVLAVAPAILLGLLLGFMLNGLF
jgi:hypothetical protein